MNSLDLAPHYAAMTANGYKLEHPEFVKLKSWHGVLFQIHSASHSLKMLMTREATLENLDDAYLEQALFYNFVLQYSKCFTSSGKGQVSLDEKRVFAGNGIDLKSHKRILEIRHNLVAHNGSIDLVIANIAVREESDHFYVRHFLTVSLPKDELTTFEHTLKSVMDYTVLSLNKHLDSLQEKLGKLVLFE